MRTKVVTWGPGREVNRPFKMSRPCECGCGSRDGFDEGVGNLSGSFADGYGITVFIYNEADYQYLVGVFGERD